LTSLAHAFHAGFPWFLGLSLLAELKEASSLASVLGEERLSFMRIYQGLVVVVLLKSGIGINIV
jgi:hypothetical protein